jgi:hypothetical protein
VDFDRVLRRRETVWTLPGWVSLFPAVTLFAVVRMQLRVEWQRCSNRHCRSPSSGISKCKIRDSLMVY